MGLEGQRSDVSVSVTTLTHRDAQHTVHAPIQ